uniref:Uncharacterized protein n=1 Tax=Ornithorhynchus anatinus TaxID=9258 RepID=F6UJH5_ORNAN
MSLTFSKGGEGRFEVNKLTGAIVVTDLPLSWDMEYVVIVQATDEYGKKSPYASVSILVGSRPPQFMNGTYNVLVPESTQVGERVAVVRALSFQRQPLLYSLVTNPSSLFSLDQQSGELALAHPMDYETQHRHYRFLARATEAESGQSGIAEVVVHITDENDCAPEFRQPIYSRENIPETIPVGTSLLQVQATDCDVGLNSEITYFIQSADFSVSAQGDVRTLRRLDFERISPLYELVVVAQDGGFPALTSTASIRIRTTNRNDEVPVFSQAVYKTFLSEDAGPNTLVAVVHAKDPDGDGVSYEIADGNEEGNFELDGQKGVIVTARTFDREKQKAHLLSIKASDQALEPLIGLCRITIFIADANDNSPKFQNSHYQYFLPEDTAVGTSFLQAAARDADLGANAAIRYSMSSWGQGQESLQIDPATGWLYVSHPVSQVPRIGCRIVATDGGNRSSTMELNVTVTGVLQPPPVWEQGDYWISIPENTTRGTRIMTLKAISPFGDPRVTYDLEEGRILEANTPIHFYLKPNRLDGSAALLVAESLDFETTPFFTLRVRARNLAPVPLASFTTVYINVTDVNDNVPFFTSSTYEAAVPEGAKIGTAVVQVLATDFDSDLHGKVQYVILKDPAGDHQFFTINPRTGVIFSEASFDREEKGCYLIEVQSRDSSESAKPGMLGQPNTDRACVRIWVIDVNDNAPAFLQPIYKARIEEDKKRGHAVITVTAKDKDEGPSTKLRYQITSGNERGTFDMDRQVGTVFVAQALDYEQERLYRLRLVVSDGKWESHTEVLIHVVNQNDEAPLFSQKEYHLHVLEELRELPIGILQVFAMDPDQEADQTALRYSLRGQGTGGEFLIDEVTGQLSSWKSLDREKRSVWHFLVLATDENGEGLTGFADVVVKVDDINDQAPFFLCATDDCFVGHVPEDAPAGTAVLDMAAVDLDDPRAGKNAALAYRISHSAQNDTYLDLFSVHPTTGTIYTLRKSLDREERDEYLVVVEVRDGGGLTGTGTATILVSDVNDHAPVFTRDVYTASVSESADPGSQVAVVSATDWDEGENAAVTFSILEGDPERKFFMETDRGSRRGWIHLRKKLDFERPHERVFNLTLRVEDADFFSLSRCVVQVEDANDHVPTFSPPRYDVPALREDVALGTVIAQVSAVDLDSGPNGRVSYHLQDQPYAGGRFSVDGDGRVKVAGPLDREAVGQHRLVILAVDEGRPALTGSATVLVTLRDVNDHAPTFEVPYRPVVWENTAAPRVVPMNETSPLLYAMDRDSAAHGAPFSFHLLSGTAPFSLRDLHNGSALLTALSTFDREVQETFHLPILITDSGDPHLSATHMLTVTVGDRNDHAHAPGHLECLVYAFEGNLPTMVLGQVHALDVDVWDEKTYHLEGKASRHFFLNGTSGILSIKEGIPPATYNLEVKVSDGVWPDVISTVKVIVKEIKEDAIRNAGSIRIPNLTAEDFIFQPPGQDSKYNQVKKVLSEIIPVQPENIDLFSVLDHQGQSQGIDIWFAAGGSSYYKAEKLNGNVAAAKTQLESLLGVDITQVGIDECANVNCSQGTGCVSSSDHSPVPSVVTAGNVSLASITMLNSAQCFCAARESRHLSCSTYKTDPCLNGGTCVDTELGFRCRCPVGFRGPECQQTQRTFRGVGYAWFPRIKPCSENHISLEFITEERDALLLYNGPVAEVQPGEAEDFIALELRDGVPCLMLNRGSGPLFLQLSPEVNVADRHWHHLKIFTNGKKVKLILDHCINASAKEESEKASWGESSHCEVSEEIPGSKRFFNIQQPLQLGGVKKFLPYHSAETHLRGFVGCVRNLVVNSKVYDLEQPAESLHSSPGCGVTDGMCGEDGDSPCGPHGTCTGEWSSFSCSCQPGYTGAKCDKVLPEWSFGRDSWLRFKLKGPLSAHQTHVQLMVRTRASSGTLLSLASAAGPGHIRLEVVNGHFGMDFSLGEEKHTVQLPTPRVDHGQWVLLQLERYAQEFTLRVNDGGGDREATLVTGTRWRFEIDQEGVLLGNHLLNHSESDFQGCMRDVQLNGRPLLVESKSAGFGLILGSQGVTVGCHSRACSIKPCYSPFHCVDLWRKYECRCPAGRVELIDGLTGLKQCSPPPCEPGSCRNGGTCVGRSPEKFICRCLDGFRGKWCEISRAKTASPGGLSSGSILAISMGLLVFLALLVSYTVWSQWGRARFQKGEVYRVPKKHESREDARGNIFNSNEEGGGEHELISRAADEFKRPRPPGCIPQPLSDLSPQEPHPGPGKDTQLTCVIHPQPREANLAAASGPDATDSASPGAEEAGSEGQNLPGDTLYGVRFGGWGTLAGSPSSLGSPKKVGDVDDDSLKESGSDFDPLKDLYELSEGQL